MSLVLLQNAQIFRLLLKISVQKSTYEYLLIFGALLSSRENDYAVQWKEIQCTVPTYTVKLLFKFVLPAGRIAAATSSKLGLTLREPSEK